MWKKCSEGQSGNDCSGGAATTHTWQGALQIPATVNISGGFAGYSDWRLPNNKELGSLVEERCYDPSINTTLFPNALVGIYWSSSPTINISAAMGFQFFYGTDYSNSRFVSYYVRLVRAGQ